MAMAARHFTLRLQMLVGLGLLWAFTSSAAAVTLKAWESQALRIIKEFEGSDFGKITADFDCQGLSLGKIQWTIAAGSIGKIFEQLSEQQIARLTGAMQRYGRDMDELIQSFRPPAAGTEAKPLQARIERALSIVRSWQTPPLTGPCDATTRGRQKPKLMFTAEQEVKQFLLDDAVISAQIVVMGRDAGRALKQAACWAQITRETWQPDFKEFVFFFDYIVQNGERWINESQLHDLAQSIVLKDADGATRKERKTEKITALADWLAAKFPHQAKSEYGEDAAKNAIILRNLHARDEIADNDLRLLYLAWFRANLGRNVFSYVTANRKFAVLFPNGHVNQTSYSFSAIIKAAGAIDASEVDAVLDQAVARRGGKPSSATRTAALCRS